MSRLVTPWLVLWALGTACGDDGTTAGVDGAAGDDASAAEVGPQIDWLADGVPPIAPPSFAPCPDGWREVPGTGDEPTTCDPYPEDGRVECPDGRIHFPGEPDCAHVGVACPATGEFSSELPADRTVVYVGTGLAPGDGSLAMPHGGLGSFSVGGLPVGSVVALSRGTHVGPLPLVRNHVVQGACAAETILTADTAAEREGVVNPAGTGGTVRDLSIADADRRGVNSIEGAAQVALQGVVVRRVRGFGIAVGRGALSGEAVVVEQIRPSFVSGEGRGVGAEAMGSLTLRRAVVRGALAMGARVSGSSLALSDTAIYGTQPIPTEANTGRGIIAANAATADLQRVVLDDNTDHGVFCSQDGTTLTMADVLIRRTRLGSDGLAGRGIGLESGPSLDGQRVLVSGNQGVGVFFDGTGGTASVSDLVVRDTGPRGDGLSGRGLNVQLGATAQVRRVIVERSHAVGVYVSAGDEGRPFEPTSLDLADAIVRDTRSSPANLRTGRGVVVARGAVAGLQRVLLDRNRDVGLLAGLDGTEIVLTDLVVRDNQAEELDLTDGRAIGLQDHVTATLERALLDGNRELGLFADGAAVTAMVTDLVVRDTLPQECSESTCPGDMVGHGIGSYDDAIVDVERFSVLRSPLCGVHVGSGGDLDLQRGEIVESSIGACLGDAGYDAARLSTGVIYRDNGVNLQAVDLPLPEASNSVM